MHLMQNTDKKVKFTVAAASIVLVCSAIIAAVGFAPNAAETDISAPSQEAPYVQPVVVEPSNNYYDVSVAANKQPCRRLYIDGVFVAACLTQEEIDAALNAALTAKAAEFGVTGTPSLANDISVTDGFCEQEQIVSQSALASLLGVTNNGYSFDAHGADGQAINLLVSYNVDYTTDVTVPYSTIYCDNDAKASSYAKTLQKGKDGLATEYYTVTYVNGEVVSRILSDTVYITEPTAKVIERGIKIGSSKTPTSLAIFEPPIDGYISSDYGWRVVFGEVNFHYGLDYTDHDVKGREVTASAGGTVIYSQWHNGGYGYRVEISHSNGMITTYSHLKSLSVKVGDVVETGDVLGIIGTTGKSTGVHVHFEVIIDGEKVDPELYVKKS